MKKTVIEEIEGPIWEIKRKWLRISLSILMGAASFVPALVISFVLGMLETFNSFYWYYRAWVDTCKGLEYLEKEKQKEMERFWKSTVKSVQEDNRE